MKVRRASLDPYLSRWIHVIQGALVHEAINNARTRRAHDRFNYILVRGEAKFKPYAFLLTKYLHRSEQLVTEIQHLLNEFFYPI